ncbi:MAG: hypothetical protein V3U14_06205 [candidate division NC10 bacterium]
MAKKGSREQRFHENLQKLENLIDPDGFFQREWEKDRNLQGAYDHFMVLFRAARERAERAARKTQLKVVRKEPERGRKKGRIIRTSQKTAGE